MILDTFSTIILICLAMIFYNQFRIAKSVERLGYEVEDLKDELGGSNTNFDD